MKTKVSTPRSFLSAASRSVSTVGLIAVFACGAAAQQWTGPDASNNISNANSGNVGIGTEGPIFGLQVEKTTAAGGGGWAALFKEPGASGIVIGSRGASTGAALASIMGINNALNAISDISLQPFGGNVGIGTTGPGAKLTVNAGGTSDILIGANSSATTYNAISLNGDITDAGKLGITGGGDIFGGGGIDKNLYIDAPTGGGFFFRLATAAKMTIDKNGYVGIGTTGPGAKLTVNAGGTSDILIGANSSATTYNAISLNGDITDAGKLGITGGGDIFGGGGIDKNLYIDAPTGGGFFFRLATAAKMTIDKNGNVGIGTTNPAEKLHVAGSIKVDGNINAKYQDLAEWVPSSEQLSAATVVVLDATRSNEVIASTQSYDTRVAGVISAQPGITLGESGEGKVLVATTGRVKVKVDASRGAIQIGDLLVTSDVPGVAMKSEPVEFAGRKMHMPGTIIGKALEPLAKGSGEILVLLSLQ